MSVLLDTDVLTILQQEVGPEFERLRRRLDRLAPDDVATSIVSYQEQVQGWMAFLNRAKTSSQIVLAFRKLDAIMRFFCRVNVVGLDEEAQECFVTLRKQRVRISTGDLRIASIALVSGSTLISRNLQDFRKVPGLTVEDWTI